MSLRTSPHDPPQLPPQTLTSLSLSSSNRALQPSGGCHLRAAIRALGFALAGRILGQARLSVRYCRHDARCFQCGRDNGGRGWRRGA